MKWTVKNSFFGNEVLKKILNKSFGKSMKFCGKLMKLHVKPNLKSHISEEA